MASIRTAVNMGQCNFDGTETEGAEEEMWEVSDLDLASAMVKLAGESVDSLHNKFDVVDWNTLEQEAKNDSFAHTVLSALKENRDVEKPLYRHQYDAMLSLANLKDTIVVTPCSSGKTRIIQHSPKIVQIALQKLKSIVIESPLAIVNVPLTSIIEDRLRNMKNTCFLSMTGELKFGDGVNSVEQVSHVHGHPESFSTIQGKELLKKFQNCINIHAVDEAHCQFDWGDEFRRMIKEVPGTNRVFSIPGSPFLALSATLRPEDIEQLIKCYGMGRRPRQIIKLNPVPEHVYIAVLSRPTNQTDFDSPVGLGAILGKLCLDQFKENPLQCKKSLILCQTEAKISDIYDDVEECIGDQYPENRTRPFVMYHSSLGPKTLHNIHQRIQSPGVNPINLLIATEKLLMGVDIANIDIVVFLQPPTTISKFVQGMGRCARPVGLPYGSRKGVAFLLFNKQDLGNNVPGMTNNMREFCKNSSCLKEFLSRHFGCERIITCSEWCCNRHKVLS